MQLDRFRLGLRNGERIDGHRGELKQDSLVGRTLSGDPIRVQVADIMLLESKTGSKAGTGFLLGGLGGGLLFAAAALQVQADETREIDPEKALAVGIGLFLVGGGIGAAMGAHSTTWEEVPLHPTLGSSGTDVLILARFSF